MFLTKAIQEFIILAPGEGYSEFTLAAYESALVTLVNYLGDCELSSVTSSDLSRFMAYLRKDYKPVRKNGQTHPLSTASHHRYWKAIRAFWKWADQEFQCGRPDADLPMPKATHRAIKPLSEEELQALLKACDAVELKSRGGKLFRVHHPHAVRDRALILTLLDTGIRVGECSRLQVKDLTLRSGIIEIEPFNVDKTTPRSVKVGAKTTTAIGRWLRKRVEVRPEEPLFTDSDGNAMSRHAIRMVLTRLGKRAGVKDVHPHRFRHTFAIQYLRNGGDIFSLKDLLGHHSFQMVNHYLHLANTDIVAAHQKASPVDRWRL